MADVVFDCVGYGTTIPTGAPCGDSLIFNFFLLPITYKEFLRMYECEKKEKKSATFVPSSFSVLCDSLLEIGSYSC